MKEQKKIHHILRSGNEGKEKKHLNVQQYTHKIQHLIVATYPEIATFSRNQTKHTIKVSNSCNFLSKRLTQKLQHFA